MTQHERPLRNRKLPFMGRAPHDADVLCPNCGNPAHLHSGSGTRDCMHHLGLIVEALTAEHVHTDDCCDGAGVDATMTCVAGRIQHGG
jgi:hypothetical protein